MPRPRTGSVYRHSDHWDIQITYPGGGRSNPICQEPGMSEAKARDKALRLTQLAAKEAIPKRPGKPSAPKSSASSRATMPSDGATPATSAA